MIVFHFLPVMDSNGENQLNAARILGGFANPGLITVVALLVVGEAMVRTGALEGFASTLHRLSGGNRPRYICHEYTGGANGSSSRVNLGNDPVGHAADG